MIECVFLSFLLLLLLLFYSSFKKNSTNIFKIKSYLYIIYRAFGFNENFNIKFEETFITKFFCYNYKKK